MNNFQNIPEVRYILNAHKKVNQMYGNMPYSVHVLGVAFLIHKYSHLLEEDVRKPVIIAGVGHDLFEDTGETYNDGKKELGQFIADIIYRVTNLRGRNRNERANDEYYAGIKECPYALFVKICDRIFNMYFSRVHGNDSMYKKYKKELPLFKDKLYNGLYDELWDVLDNIEDIEIPVDGFPKIEKFDKDNIHGVQLPRIITAEIYIELYRKGVIEKKDLRVGFYYYGKCRNAKVAVWNGFCFVYMRSKFCQSFPENINHLHDDDGADLFIPIGIADVVEPHQIVTYQN